ELDAWQADDGAHRGGQLRFSDERDGVDGDSLAANVMSIRLGDRSQRHLTDLGPAAHADDPLSIDLYQRPRLLNAHYAFHFFQSADDRVGVGFVREREFEINVGERAAAVHVDVSDVGVMAGEHAGQVEEHAWTIGDGQQNGVSAHAWRQDTGELVNWGIAEL